MKISKFTNIVKSEGSYVLHNSLYNSAIKITDPELKTFIDNVEDKSIFEYDENNDFHKVLYDLKIIINEDINENNIVNYYAQQRKRDSLQIIMVVTRQCNFKCPYCYQDHVNDKTMTQDLLNQTRLAILKKVKEDDYKKVEVAWFGGEPTLELNKIIPFMKQLKKGLPDHVSLVGQMTTNAYLLNIENLKKLVDVNITRYQITVDGLAATHNTTRILANNQPTWDTIIKNLEDAKKSDLYYMFTIRTNFTAKIVENAKEWFQFLKDHFSGDDRISFYFESVKNLGELHDYVLDYSDLESIDASAASMSVAKDVGLEFKPFYRRMSPFGMGCYASNPSSFTIDYDGTIKKCTVSFDRPKNFVGEVKNESFCIDDGKFSWWTSYDHDDDCKECSIYPACFAEKCPNSYKTQTACSVYKALYFDTLKMLL